MKFRVYNPLMPETDSTILEGSRIFLGRIQTLDQGPPVTAFVKTLAWVGSVAPYTMTILGSEHGKGVNPFVLIRKTVGTSAADATLVTGPGGNPISVHGVTGDITLTSQTIVVGKALVI
jgi:hypothetical protein